MTEPKYKAGVFIVPEEHLAEIARLCERAEGPTEIAEDSEIWINRAYRHAKEVAIEHVEWLGESAYWGAGILVERIQYFVGIDPELIAFTRKQCELLATEIPRAVERQGGAEAFISARTERISTFSWEVWAEIYQAIIAGLDRAQALDAGMACMTCDEVTEARAESIRRSPEAYAEARRRIEEGNRTRALLQKLKEKSDRMTVEEMLAGSDDMGAAWLCAVDEGIALEHRAAIERLPSLLDWADEDDEDEDWDDDEDELEDGESQVNDEDNPYAVANLRIYTAATKRAELRKYNEVTTISGVDAIVKERAPDLHQPTGVYTADQARELLGVVLAWETEMGGEPAAVEHLLDTIYGYKSYIRRALRALKRILKAAVKKQLAYVWFTSDTFRLLDEIAASSSDAPRPGSGRR